MEKTLQSGKKTRNRHHYNIPVFIVLLVFSIIMIYPFIWMVFSAFKTQKDVYTIPVKLIPSTFTMENFKKVFRMIPFGRYYANSIITSVLQTAIQISMSICAAFAFAKLRFPFKKFTYILVQSAMFVPMSVLIIPLYQLVCDTKLVDTYPGIILPQVLGVFTTMLLFSFFLTIPDDLIDAAKIDGCNYFSILLRVVIPNSASSISAAILYAFLSHWRSYLWPLLVTNKTEMRTLAVGLKYLISEASSSYQVMIAGALMSILPLMIIYILCEKQFVKSMVLTGLKG